LQAAVISKKKATVFALGAADGDFLLHWVLGPPGWFVRGAGSKQRRAHAEGRGGGGPVEGAPAPCEAAVEDGRWWWPRREVPRAVGS